jgi:hypothetical protein
MSSERDETLLMLTEPTFFTRHTDRGRQKTPI